MQPYQPAKLLRLLITERDRYQGKPLYEAVIEKCREMKIAGATVFRGLEGYGDTAEIHRSHVLRHDLPIIALASPLHFPRRLPQAIRGPLLTRPVPCWIVRCASGAGEDERGTRQHALRNAAAIH